MIAGYFKRYRLTILMRLFVPHKRDELLDTVQWAAALKRKKKEN